MSVVAGTTPLRLNQPAPLRDRRGRALVLERVDGLLWDFALQRRDGRWVGPGTSWHAFFRAGPLAPAVPLPGIDPGTYVAARFVVGVDPQRNHADPNRLPPGDPLHPVVNGLHWGWTGGYVFLAAEGHWQLDRAAAGDTGGFSYHIGGNANRVAVTLPGPFTVHAGQPLVLRLDAARMLSKIDIVRDGDSTHSRTEDNALRAVRAGLREAFSLHTGTAGAAAAATARTGRQAAVASAGMPRGTPYPVAVASYLPTASWPADNPPTVEGVALGKLLFNDRRLSRDGSLSCASCHHENQAFSDPGRAVSTGIGGRTGRRNSMPLFNLVWVPSFFWDGRAASLREQVLQPIEDPDEMGHALPQVVTALTRDRALSARFVAVFGGPPSRERIALALEQYLMTLLAQDSRYDRMLTGRERFTPQEQRGFELFLTEHDPARGLRGADCFHCHGGNLFTNHRATNNGLPERGGDRGKFRTPSLRNVALTAPYMHDGRFATLEEVIEHYDRGVVHSPTLDPNLAKHSRQGMGLSAADKAALVAFLRTLTDAPRPSPERPAATPVAAR